MHYDCYWHRQFHLITQRRRKGLLPSTPLPAIDLAALLTNKEENLKPEQMNVSHESVMELLGNPDNPLHAEPHSMTEHFDAITAGAHAIGELPSWTHCRDNDATVRVYDNEAKQVRQKILRYLDMRVMDGDLIVPTCLRMPTLILPAGHFAAMYYDPDAQGQYASQFPTGGQGFLQPHGNIRTSIMPRNFHMLPANVREVVDQYFHREELERKADLDEEEDMSTDTEAAETVRQLQLDCPTAMASLQVAVHEALAPAMPPLTTTGGGVLLWLRRLGTRHRWTVSWVGRTGCAMAGRPTGNCLCTTMVAVRLRKARTISLWQIARPAREVEPGKISQGSRPGPSAVSSPHAAALC